MGTVDLIWLIAVFGCLVWLVNAFGLWTTVALMMLLLAIGPALVRSRRGWLGCVVLAAPFVASLIWLVVTFGWWAVLALLTSLVVLAGTLSGGSRSRTPSRRQRIEGMRTPSEGNKFLRSHFLREWEPVNLAGRRAWERDDIATAAQCFEQLQALVARFRESADPGNSEMQWTLNRVTLPLSADDAGQWWQAQMILAGGRVWKRWRKAHASVKPDLRDRWLCTRGQMNISGIDLSDADLRGAVLRNARLVNADLRRAQLAGAVLAGANLQDALLDKADLCDVDLTGVQGLTESQLRTARRGPA